MFLEITYWTSQHEITDIVRAATRERYYVIDVVNISTTALLKFGTSASSVIAAVVLPL